MQCHLESYRDEIKLRVGKETLVCLKQNLCKRSGYFRGMFTHEFVEKDKEEIILNDVDEKAFKFILDCKPLGNLTEIDDILNVMKVSSMLQFDKETEACEKYILDNFVSICPVRVMVASFELDKIKLYKKATAYSLWNFCSLKSSPDMVGLPFLNLLRFVDNEGLRTVNGEIEVFETIQLWIDRNEAKNEYIVTLMKTLRYKSLTLRNMENIRSSACVQKVTYLHKLLGYMIEYFREKMYIGCSKCCTDTVPVCWETNSDVNCLCSVDKAFLVPVNDLLSKKPRVLPIIPCHVISKTDEFPIIYAYNGEKVIKLLSLSRKPFTKTFIGYRIIAVGFKIYFFGGEQGLGYGMFNMGVWSYNLINEAWNHESDMLQQRRHFFITSLDDWIFVLGGTGKHRKVLDNIEKYNIKTKKWSDCIGLNQKALEAVCSFNNKIYIASRTILVYNPYENIFDGIPIDLPSSGVSFITIYKKYLYSVDRDNATVRRWKLFNCDTTHYREENLGNFQQTGETLLINNDIYHFSCFESDLLYCVEKLCLDTLKIVTVSTTKEIGEFQSKYIGCFSVPSYF